jgi:hypothetical protein
MFDVLHDEELIQEDAAAVLGGSDAKNCTYNEVRACTRMCVCAFVCPVM